MNFPKLLKEWKEKIKTISEGLSNILYHATSLTNLKEILEDNRFMLTAALGSKSDFVHNKNKFYFFSASRSKMSSYTKSVGISMAMIVLDGQKLSQRYKGTQVDYWGTNFQDSDEMEDRIVSDKPYIENVINYILEVHILYDLGYKYSSLREDDFVLLKNIEDSVKEKNIPLFLYIDFDSWRKENKTKSVSTVDEIKQIVINSKREMEPHQEYEPYKSDHSYFKRYVDLIKGVESKKYLNMTPEERSEFMYSKEGPQKEEGATLRRLLYYTDDFITYLKNDIHNERSKKREREYMNFIFSYMRKNKLTSIEELASFLKRKLDRD